LRRTGKCAKGPRPDLIFLKLGLPGISEKDVLAAVKGDAALESLPVVVLTASVDPADRADVEHFDLACVSPSGWTAISSYG